MEMNTYHVEGLENSQTSETEAAYQIPEGAIVLQGTTEEILIELVRSKPYLFNIKERGYRDMRLKESGWQVIAQILNITPAEAERLWKLRRDTFLRVHKQRTSSKSNHVWPLYEAMLWYLDFANIRTRTRSNFMKSSHSQPASSDTSTPSQDSGMSVNLETPPENSSSMVPPFTYSSTFRPSPSPSPTAEMISPTFSPSTSRTPSPSTGAELQSISATAGTEHVASKRVIPSPDMRKGKSLKQRDEIGHSLLEGVSEMANAVKAVAARSFDVTTSSENRTLEAFKMLVAAELAEVPEEKRSSCRLAVLETIQQFK